MQLGIQMDNIGDLSSIKKDKREEGNQINGADQEANGTTELFDQINNTTQMIIEITNKNFDSN